MLDEVAVELRRVGCHPRHREVVHRPLRAQPHGEADVAELQVEVHDDGATVVGRQRHREVRRHERLPGAPLRTEDGDDPAFGGRRDAGVTARHRLGERQVRVAGRHLDGRDLDDVLGAGTERIAQEPVRRACADDHDRATWICDRRSPQELERLVGLVTADDEQRLGILAPGPPHRRISDRCDGDSGIADHALDQFAVDAAVDRDERTHGGVAHGVPFGSDSARVPATDCSVTVAGAPLSLLVGGRSANHTLPLSAA